MNELIIANKSDITNIAVTTSTITLNFSALLEATDFFCRVESIS